MPLSNTAAAQPESSVSVGRRQRGTPASLSAYHSSLDSQSRPPGLALELYGSAKPERSLRWGQAAAEEGAAATEAQRQQLTAQDEAAAELRDRLTAARQQGADAAEALEDARAAAEHAEADAASKQVLGGRGCRRGGAAAVAGDRV